MMQYFWKGYRCQSNSDGTFDQYFKTLNLSSMSSSWRNFNFTFKVCYEFDLVTFERSRGSEFNGGSLRSYERGSCISESTTISHLINSKFRELNLTWFYVWLFIINILPPPPPHKKKEIFMFCIDFKSSIYTIDIASFLGWCQMESFGISNWTSKWTLKKKKNQTHFHNRQNLESFGSKIKTFKIFRLFHIK